MQFREATSTLPSTYLPSGKEKLSSSSSFSNEALLDATDLRREKRKENRKRKRDEEEEEEEEEEGKEDEGRGGQQGAKITTRVTKLGKHERASSRESQVGEVRGRMERGRGSRGRGGEGRAKSRAARTKGR